MNDKPQATYQLMSSPRREDPSRNISVNVSNNMTSSRGASDNAPTGDFDDLNHAANVNRRSSRNSHSGGNAARGGPTQRSANMSNHSSSAGAEMPYDESAYRFGQQSQMTLSR